MLKVVCSVFDVKAGVFSNPFYAANAAVAVRDFNYAVSDPQTAISRNPEDYILYHVATFDDESGLFTAVNPPAFLANAKPNGE